MKQFDPSQLKSLYMPPAGSHKGMNGKVLIIAGSELFHAASLWPLSIASKLVDMVFYASVPSNNKLVQNAKSEFRNGIVIPREKIDEYINESDSILIGPGLPRLDGQEKGDDDTKLLTESLLQKYNNKKWVIDGGSLQVIDPELLLQLKQTPILTPHEKEFETLFQNDLKQTSYASDEEKVCAMAKKYNVVILLKGEVDIVSSPEEYVSVSGGNAGMTKGGTGDVLAGLAVALYAKNDAFLSAVAASYINKKAGEALFEKVGFYFNASDLVEEIPKVMKILLMP